MRSTKLTVFCFLLTALAAQAATVSGTVTNKTTGKPAAGDAVELVDVQAGMSTAVQTTTDRNGHYSIDEPRSGPYLVRAMHQGAGYFIAAPQGSGTGDITVYDVAAKVVGVAIDEDMVGVVQADHGQLHVVERYLVHNSSNPLRTQWSPRSFEIVLPAEAMVDGVSAQRPAGLATSTKLDPDGPKGHYSFNFPIQPDNGEKGTLFQIEYQLPYDNGKFTFHPNVSLPARTVWVILPKSMNFASGAGSDFQSAPQDPAFQTFLARDAVPGKALEFTVSGNGAIPREEQGGQQPGSGMGAQDNGNGAQETGPGARPGGGIGVPVNTPDPLTKYKWWILGGLALLLVVAAAFLLRKPVPSAVINAGSRPTQAVSPAATNSSALLNALKEELFALESEKIHGAIKPEEYAKVKAALETVLKRALSKTS